ncbi:MAG: DUF808 domain-containing protein [Burkholderiaceae bacterium]|nr:DUF808 domain-containing protein [Burkholderiaceae bacterium]
MAGASLLTLLDDIATVLDDVAVMAKVAAKKTAGVLGDDLALNAEQVSGVPANRELPVVWAVCKGSLKNKIILVPLALALSAFAPWAVGPLLMVGGAYLCFEGFEKISHKFLHDDIAEQSEHTNMVEAQALADPDVEIDIVEHEKEKIKGAIRTDFVLSAEIIIIALGTVAAAPFLSQVTVLAGVALLMTVGVYGFVAAIVKLDDIGFYLKRKSAEAAANQGTNFATRMQDLVGDGLLVFAPRLMKTLAVVGTIAMFMVGGGILTHGIPVLHHWIEASSETIGHAIALPNFLISVMASLMDAIAGVVAGGLVLVVVTAMQWVLKKFRK